MLFAKSEIERLVWHDGDLLFASPDQITKYAQETAAIDYVQIKNDLDSMEAKFKSSLRDVLIESRDALLATVKRNKGDLPRDFKLPYTKDIQQVIGDALQRAMDRGEADASKEIGRAKKDYAEGQGGKWITMNGRHVFIKDGETPEQALEKVKQSGEFNGLHVKGGGLWTAPRESHGRRPPRGKFLAAYTDKDGYTIRITGGTEKGKEEGLGVPRMGTMSIVHPDGRFVKAGYFMGWPEKEWGLSQTDLNKVSWEKRAAREVQWQATNPAYSRLKDSFVFHADPARKNYGQHNYAKAPTFTPKAALKWLRAKAFWVTDVLVTGLLEDIRLVIINGLKTGMPTSDIITAIAQKYIPYLGDPTAVAGPGAELPTAARLETVVRTNLVEAYNQGRIATFIKPDMMPFLDGIRYSAILDTRTTPVCRYLDGRIFKPTDIQATGLVPPNHFNCFLHPDIKVYTAKGWQCIKDIELGDLVLTKKGRFRPVTYLHHRQNPVSYKGEVIRLHFDRDNHSGLNIRVKPWGLSLTPDHPLLTERGWVAAKDMHTGDRVVSLAYTCSTCGTVFPRLFIPSSGEGQSYCSKNCQVSAFHASLSPDDRRKLYEKVVNTRRDGDNFQHSKETKAKIAIWWSDPTNIKHISDLASAQMRREYASGVRDGKKITAAAHAATRKLFADGWDHPMHSPDGKARALIARINSPVWQSGMARIIGGWPSKGQSSLFSLAKKIWPSAVTEYAVKCKAGKAFSIDVALVKHKIGLEYDGSYWHVDGERDIRRDKLLSQQGWSILRYVDRVPTRAELRADVNRVLSNHAGEYKFTSVEVKKATRYKLKKARRLYNMSVEEDESYVVYGLVSANCRSLCVPVVVGEISHAPDFKVDPKVYITDEEILHAQALADVKFLEQEDDVHEFKVCQSCSGSVAPTCKKNRQCLAEKAFAEEGSGVWRTVRGRKVFIREGEDLDTALKRSLGKSPIGKGEDLTTKEIRQQLLEVQAAQITHIGHQEGDQIDLSKLSVSDRLAVLAEAEVAPDLYYSNKRYDRDLSKVWDNFQRDIEGKDGKTILEEGLRRNLFSLEKTGDFTYTNSQYATRNAIVGLSSEQRNEFESGFLRIYKDQPTGSAVPVAFSAHDLKQAGWGNSELERFADKVNAAGGKALYSGRSIDSMARELAYFSKDYETFRTEAFSNWASVSNSTGAGILRRASEKAFPNGRYYNAERDSASDVLFSSDRVVTNLKKLKAETEAFYQAKLRTSDLASKPLPLSRGVGVKAEAYAPGALEAWTKDKRTAERFADMMSSDRGGKSILSTTVTYNDVLWSYESVKGKPGWPAEKDLKGKKEFVMLGARIKKIDSENR